MCMFASKGIDMLDRQRMTIYTNNNNIHYGEWLRCKPFRAFNCYLTNGLILVNSYMVDLSIRGIFRSRQPDNKVSCCCARDLLFARRSRERQT